VVLDVMLPGLSGLEVLRRRRGSDDAASVLTVSARGDEDDRVLGLETGADDYLAKPVSPRELVVRVHALVRRAERLGAAGLSPRTLTLGPLTIDVGAHRVHRTGPDGSGRPEAVGLTAREFDLLAFLAAHPGQTFSKQELLARVWGWEFGDSSTVTVHVRRLREKIERDPSDPTLVLTVPRVGYRSRDREPDAGGNSGPITGAGGETGLDG